MIHKLIVGLIKWGIMKITEFRCEIGITTSFTFEKHKWSFKNSYEWCNNFLLAVIKCGIMKTSEFWCATGEKKYFFKT